MSVPLRHNPVRSVLLDIEGTTTPIEFVYNVLFPYARARMKDFLAQHSSSPDVRADLNALREEHARDQHRGLNPPPLHKDSTEAELESAVVYLHWLMDGDRKSTPLKSLQGKIWEEGYTAGQLRSEIFADVLRAFERWQKANKRTCIFSSGSVLAQKLLFAHTTAGDLTRFIHAYFDTTTGAKVEPESYRRIAKELKQACSEILFVSDVTAELDAAQSAGMETVLCVRPGNRPQPGSHTHRVIHTFDEVLQ